MAVSTGSCSVVFTADQGIRGGKIIPLKQTVDDAVRGCDCVRRVFVAKRTGAEVNMEAGRDVWLEEVRCDGTEREGGREGGRRSVMRVWMEVVGVTQGCI